MKILPITNNNIQNKNIAHKGFVGENTTHMVESMSKDIKTVAKDLYEGNTHMKATATWLSERVSNILNNMQTIMLNFGKTCQLDYIEHKKADSSKENIALFVITSKDSDYAKVVGSVKLSETICLQNILELENVVQHLLTINPDKTNVNFKIMKKLGIYDYKGDSFAPEERIWFPEDRLKLPSNQFSKPECDIIINAAKKLNKSGSV